MSKNIDLAYRYYEVLSNLRKRMEDMNTSSSDWFVGNPTNRGDASELQKRARKLYLEREHQLQELLYAWKEYIEIVDERGLEAYSEMMEAGIANGLEPRLAWNDK